MSSLRMDNRRGASSQLMQRVGDSERDACVSALIGHHLHGRLSVEDLERRQLAAMTAVTTADLRLLLADLPDSGNERTTSARPPSAPDKVDEAKRAAKSLLPVAPVLLGGAWFSQWFWQYSAEGPFLGALAGGALGYAAHAVSSRLRR